MTYRRSTKNEKTLVLLIAISFVSGALAAPNAVVRHSSSVPGEYFVRLHNGESAATTHLARSIAAAYRGEILAYLQAGIGGFAIKLTPEAAEALANDPRIEFVEENPNVDSHIENISSSPTVGMPNDNTYLWHLDRVDQRYGPLNNDYQHTYDGQGTIVYMLDEGVDNTHEQLTGKILLQHDFMSPQANVSNPCVNDANGWHGTAIASLIAGNTMGVARSASIVALNTMNCVGQTPRGALPIIAALNWIISSPNQAPSYVSMPSNPYYGTRAVLNMSGFTTPGITATDGTWTSPSVDTVFRNVMMAGITTVTSANNWTMNACSFSPANTAYGRIGWPQSYAISVGGTAYDNSTMSDTRWNDRDANGAYLTGVDAGSNSGNCITIWAPAANIYSARHSPYRRDGNLVKYDTRSGTSFASAITAGVVARYMQYFKATSGRFPSASEVQGWIDNTSTKTTTGGAPLVTGTATPAWTGNDPFNTGVYHPAVDTWRTVGLLYWNDAGL